MYAYIVCRVLVGAYCGGYLLVAWACTPGAGALPWRAWVLPVGAFRFRHSLWALTHSPRGYSRRGRSCGSHAPRRALSGAGALLWVLCAPDVLSALTPPAHSRRSLWRSHSPARTLSGAGVYSRRALSLWRSLPAWLLTAPRGRSHTPRAGTYAPPALSAPCGGVSLVVLCSRRALRRYSPCGRVLSPSGALCGAHAPPALCAPGADAPCARSIAGAAGLLPGAHYLPRACSCRRLCARGYVARTNPVRGIIFMQIRGLTCAFIIVKKQFAFWVVLLTRCLL